MNEFGWRSDKPREDEPEWWESAIDGTGPLEHTDFDNEELPEEFIPPTPPPFPYISPPTVLGTLGILLGLWALLWPGPLTNWLSVSTTLVLLLGIGAVLAGAITLVGRLRNPDEDEELDDDDGARV